MKNLIYATLLSLAALPVNGWAQGTVDDYKRAGTIDKLYASKVWYSNVTPVWIGKTSCFWYIRNTPEGKEFILVDATTGKKSALFNQATLATKLSEQTGKVTDAEHLPFHTLEVSPDLHTINFVYDGYHWNFTHSRKATTLTKGRRAENRENRYWGDAHDDSKSEPVISPDSLHEVFLKNNNLYIRTISSGKEVPLSFDGSPGDYYSNEIVWSPDSKKVAIMKVRPAEKRYIQFIEAAPKDQLQPRLHKRFYPKPGDALPYHYPHIFNITEGTQVKPDNRLFQNPYATERLKWNNDSRALTFEYNERGHQVYRVLEVDANSGTVRPLVEETQKTFINYGRYFRHDLSNGKEMIWMSERDNWNHLYMYDRNTGKVKHQITKGAWYVRNVVSVDEANQQIIFSANGMVENEDPYLVRYYRIHFDGSGLTCLTPEEGMHQGTFSADKRYFVDVYSKVDVPPVALLRETATGKIILPLEKADITELKKAGWIAPEVFSAKGRDGKTDIWGVIVRPSNFDPAKKYPVLEYIYAGPGNQHTPKTFAPTLRFLNNTAELGFIVVMLDGMGTSFRSKAFEDVICKNLKDAGFPDRIAWIKAAAIKYPYMDVEKVGLYGGSAGGQNAMAGVLFHPEFYKAAYAGCGCHDNRMDKIWWNEQWMGYPIGEQYSACSNVDNAWRLTRPLMLMVGENDDNVDPATTMQVVNALQKAGKEFELIVVPGSNHTIGGPYGDRKRYDFFVKQLWNLTPPDWNSVKYPG